MCEVWSPDLLSLTWQQFSLFLQSAKLVKGQPNDRSSNRLWFTIIAIGHWSSTHSIISWICSKLWNQWYPYVFNAFHVNNDHFHEKILTFVQSLHFLTCLHFQPCCWYTLNYKFAQGSLMLCWVSWIFIGLKMIVSWSIIGRLWPWSMEHSFEDQFHTIIRKGMSTLVTYIYLLFCGADTPFRPWIMIFWSPCLLRLRVSYRD